MTEHSTPETLISIWEQHRNRILTYGHALHGLLPEGNPPITLHGRDLRPDDEGVGFQFQYTLADNLYNGEVKTASFVVQIEIVKRRTSVGVKIDAVPILEYSDRHYELYARRGTITPIGDKRELRQYFAQSLTLAAAHFFTRVRKNEPMDEIIAGIAGPASTA